MPDPPQAEIERMLEAANRPLLLRETPREELVGPAGECRGALRDWVNKSLDDLRSTEEQVVNDVDIPALEAVTGRAAVINDPTQARKFHRLGGEYRTTMYKSLKLLDVAQTRDGAQSSVDPDRRDRPQPARTRKPRGQRQTADVETPTTVGESLEGPENAGFQTTETSEGQGGWWFSTEVSGESRFEPSRAEDAAPDEPSGAVPTGSDGDGPGVREGEAAAEAPAGTFGPFGGGRTTPPSAGPEVSPRGGPETFVRPPRRGEETRAEQEPSGAVPTGSDGDDNVDREAPWWVPARQLREVWPASDPVTAGAEPGRPPPQAG
jgi:hypothetical protein